MRLTLEHFLHPTAGLTGSCHIAEQDGIRFATPYPVTNDFGNYIKERISGFWYISGVRILTWPDGNQYHVAMLEYAERPFLSIYEHDGWHLPPGEVRGSNKVRTYVPALGEYIYADRKSPMIHLNDDANAPRGRIWIGSSKGRIYFAGLDDTTNLRIRKGKHEPDPAKRGGRYGRRQ